MRIAFVAGGLPLGGTTTFTLFLAAALRILKVQVEIFSFSAAHPLQREFQNSRLVVHRENEKKYIYEDRVRSLYRKLLDFKPQAVFAVLGAESFEVLRYLPAGVLRIGVFHDFLSPPLYFAERYKSVLDHCIVIAPYLKQAIQKRYKNIPCSYLQHGIPISKLPPRNPNYNKPLRILYYGRLENISKGVKTFPCIVKALQQLRIAFSFTIHGSGPEENFLKTSFSQETRLGIVSFSKPVKYKVLLKIIRKHDIFLLASNYEGGPLTLLESMSLGLVPVCGDIPGLVQEVITRKNGFRVCRSDPNSFAEAIWRLDVDRNLLEKMSKSARQKITQAFSAKAMAIRYINFLRPLFVYSSSIRWKKKICVQPILRHDKFSVFLISQDWRRFFKFFNYKLREFFKNVSLF